MAEFTNPKDVFEQMPTRFNKEAAKGMAPTVYQFVLTGGQATEYHVVIENQTCTAQEGKHPSPNITITINAQDYMDMANGKLNPMQAFMGGKLKVAGDMMLAMKMQSLFPQ
ncbi:MAG: SCP2 sterol-binding domain-containing protein [Candidatus Binatia bacterium]